VALADARASDTVPIQSAVADSLCRRTLSQFVAKSATKAGMASHRSPFTRKNMKPQNPSRLIQVFITLGRFDHAARTMISALSVSRTAGGSNDLTKI